MKATNPQKDILRSRQQVNLFLAGQGSGKSHCAGFVSANYISNFPLVRGLIAANTSDQLKDSTLFRIREVWREMGINEWNKDTRLGNYVVDKQPPPHFNRTGHNFKTYNNIISFVNGAVIFLRSLENYMAADGLEIAWAILDETKDTREIAVKEVITGRLRQSGMYIGDDGKLNAIAGTAFTPLYIFTSPARVPWLNEWFNLDSFEPEIVGSIYSETTYFTKSFDNKFVTISSTYHNIANLPENYIENQKMNLPSHLHDMLIYANPFSKSGGEFYPMFERGKHVKKIDYNDEYPVHVVFDKNVTPYVSCAIWQVIGNVLKQVHELPCKEPDNTSVKAAKKLIDWLRKIDYADVIYIYGDPSANARSATEQDGKSFFDKIIETLKYSGYTVVKRVGESSPRVALSAEFVNDIFEEHPKIGYKIVISDKCNVSSTDYGIVKKDPNGGMVKNKIPHPLTKIPYEPYGHYSDNLRYFVCQLLKKDFDKYGNSRGASTNIIRR